MPLWQYGDAPIEPGYLIGKSDDRIIYKVVSCSSERQKSPSGKMAYKMKLERATEDEETVFRLMES